MVLLKQAKIAVASRTSRCAEHVIHFPKTNSSPFLMFFFSSGINCESEKEKCRMNMMHDLILYPYTVISLHVWPPLVSEHLPKANICPKHQHFPSQKPVVWTSRKPPPIANHHDNFLDWRFDNFPYVLTCSARPFDEWPAWYLCSSTTSSWTTLQAGQMPKTET